MNWGASRPVCEVRRVNQSVLLPPGLCEGLYGQPTVSLRSPLPWSGISIPAADTEGKVFPLVVVKEELSRALQDTHCCCFFFFSQPWCLWTRVHGMPLGLLGEGQQAGTQPRHCSALHTAQCRQKTIH